MNNHLMVKGDNNEVQMELAQVLEKHGCINDFRCDRTVDWLGIRIVGDGLKKGGIGMEKQLRKARIAKMTIAAGLAHQCVQWGGVCGVSSYLDRREPLLHYSAGVLLQPEAFYEYFGEDTFYEYRDIREDGSIEVATEVNGVTFYALIDDSDILKNGRPV